MPNIYEVEDNRVKVLEAANRVTSEYKVLKAYLSGDRLWLAIEMFVDSTPEVGEFMQRCIGIMLAGRKDIAQYIFGNE